MSHPQGLELDEVKDEDHVDAEEEMEKAEVIRDGMREDGDIKDWNHDNLPPHANDELFKEKHNL